MIFFSNRLGGEAGEQSESGVQLPSRREVLDETRRNAEADAIRHAEDLLEREFPIVSSAERTAESRLAALHTSYVEARGEMETEGEAIRQNVEVMERRLHQAEDALRAAGVPENELALLPLQRGNVKLLHAVMAVGATAAVGLALSQVVSGPGLIAVGVLVAIGLIVWLILVPDEDLEPAKLGRLRQNQVEGSRELQKLLDRQVRNTGSIEQLESSTYSKGQSEIAFAGELVAAYATAAFSALPAGSLEGGRQIAAQREPEIEEPVWLQALAPEDE